MYIMHSNQLISFVYLNITGIVDAALMPLLALLVDTRHVTTYGTIYAIAQLSVCLAYGIGY